MSNKKNAIFYNNNLINKLYDSVLIPFGSNLEQIINILNTEITINTYLDMHMSLLLTEFTQQTAKIFTNILLENTIDDVNIIDITDCGIYFKFFDVFSMNSIKKYKIKNCRFLQNYLFLCTKNFLTTESKKKIIKGKVFTDKDLTIVVYSDILKMQDLLNKLIKKKKYIFDNFINK